MPFMVTVMVQYIVSEMDEVMTATICVVLVLGLAGNDRTAYLWSFLCNFTD
jgi:hypothetical protein